MLTLGYNGDRFGCTTRLSPSSQGEVDRLGQSLLFTLSEWSNDAAHYGNPSVFFC